MRWLYWIAAVSAASSPRFQGFVCKNYKQVSYSFSQYCTSFGLVDAAIEMRIQDHELLISSHNMEVWWSDKKAWQRISEDTELPDEVKLKLVQRGCLCTQAIGKLVGKVKVKMLNDMPHTRLAVGSPPKPEQPVTCTTAPANLQPNYTPIAILIGIGIFAWATFFRKSD